MPKRYANQLLLVRKEVTYDTDPAVSATHAVLAFNVTWKPMQGDDVKRKPNTPWFSAADTVNSSAYAEVSGEIELIGRSTAGSAPGWSALAQCLRLKETIVANTSVTYEPVTNAIPSATIIINIDGVQQKLTGCRGQGKVQLNAQKIPVIAFTLWGNYSEPTDTVALTPTLTGFQVPQIASRGNTPTFTINGAAVPLHSFELDFGNKMDFTDIPNLREISHLDGEPSWSATVDAVNMTVFNPFVLNTTRAAVPIVLGHGIGAGKIATLTMPICRVDMVKDAANQNSRLVWKLSGPVLPSAAGNDDFAIVLT